MQEAFPGQSVLFSDLLGYGDCREKNKMKRPVILVTGATGLVGEAVVMRLLVDRQFVPVAAVRGGSRLVGLCKVVPFVLAEQSCLPALEEVDVVVHCAARVHVMSETALDALAEFRAINVEGTVNLARQAAAAGVKRFIFISSIKVNGERTISHKPFRFDDPPAPQDPYGISKWEAEQALSQIALETGMELVVIRPPLVYGPRVKGNFLSMMSWLNKRVSLPLGCISNRRSLVSLANLVDLIITCIDHPAAAGNAFLVSDGDSCSTTQLIMDIGHLIGQPAPLIPVPVWMLKSFLILIGKRIVAQRLFDTLEVNIVRTEQHLGWTPPVSRERALRQTIEHYLETLKK
ncbi:UDP-glucose 4-epimerase family protein [Pseudomonas sp. NPDC088429]|uniref:UDP-glucose 4-epimerase family protein n=1 Tax=Pseudomonas sp. NPDC088429 TaxID=3364455 RepID=UPI00381E7DD9